MQPIGLMFKDYQVNPFTDRGSGELMVVHQCLNCGKLSPNRIAGDDNSEMLLSLLTGGALTLKIDNQEIKLLTQKDKAKVLACLFGWN